MCNLNELRYFFAIFLISKISINSAEKCLLPVDCEWKEDTSITQRFNEPILQQHVDLEVLGKGYWNLTLVQLQPVKNLFCRSLFSANIDNKDTCEYEGNYFNNFEPDKEAEKILNSSFKIFTNLLNDLYSDYVEIIFIGLKGLDAQTRINTPKMFYDHSTSGDFSFQWFCFCQKIFLCMS